MKCCKILHIFGPWEQPTDQYHIPTVQGSIQGGGGGGSGPLGKSQVSIGFRNTGMDPTLVLEGGPKALCEKS